MVPLPGWPFLGWLATPSTLVVSQVAGPYTTIESAIDDAEPGTRIEIHDGGTFTESLTIPLGVTLIGVGVRPVLVSADPGGDDGVFRIDADGQDVTLENLAFDGEGTSRAMRVHRGRLHVVGCTFDDHQETASGGTITSDPQVTTVVDLVDSVFTNSTAGADGGFVSMPDGTLSVAGCSFSGGSGRSGGALHMGTGSLTVADSGFDDNTATTDGGAIHSLGPTTVVDTAFTDNEAPGNGGAVAQVGSSASFTRVVACDNEATNAGGALYFTASSGIVVNSVFVRNQAGDSGGAIRVDGASVQLVHVSAVANDGDPGEAFSGEGSLAIVDTYIGHHTPNEAVASSDDEDVTIEFSGLSDNTADLDSNTDDLGDNQFGNAGIPLPPVGSCNPADLEPPVGSDLIGNASDGLDIGALDGASTWPDSDGDGFLSFEDCNDADPTVNPGATDTIGDGIDQDCDGNELCYQDADGDGFAEAADPIPTIDRDCADPGEFATPTDVCPGFDDRLDDDGDAVPNDCDECPDDAGPGDDLDDDEVCNSDDACPGFDDDLDTDGDGVPNGCDECSADDSDGDGTPDDCDLCPGTDDAADRDGDGNPDGCDPCPDDDPNDTDGDDVCDADDVCPGSDDRVDTDQDGIADGCDDCAGAAGDDTDGDGVCDLDDPCPTDAPDDPDGDGTCGDEGPRTPDTGEAPSDDLGCGCGSGAGAGWLAIGWIAVMLRRLRGQ